MINRRDAWSSRDSSRFRVRISPAGSCHAYRALPVTCSSSRCWKKKKKMGNNIPYFIYFARLSQQVWQAVWERTSVDLENLEKERNIFINYWPFHTIRVGHEKYFLIYLKSKFKPNLFFFFFVKEIFKRQLTSLKGGIVFTDWNLHGDLTSLYWKVQAPRQYTLDLPEKLEPNLNLI